MSNELNGNKKGNKSATHFLPIVFAIVLISGMYLGGRLQQSVPFKLDPLHKEDHQKVAKVLEVINQKYVDSTNNDVLVRAAIKGILKKLDPHSIYVAAKDFDQANEQLEGNFEGIGIRFFVVNDTIMVVSPITGGPSAALGIRPGDKIIMIEDELAAGVGITDEDVVKKLRGPKGSKVRISILRARHKSLIDFTITRDKIPLFSIDVSYMIDDKVGFIKLSHFSKSTEAEFTEAMIKLRKSGMERLILDLRRNPGGFLAAATAISDEFIGKDKLIVYTEGRAQPRFEFKATSKGSFETGALVVLIDEGSASASEIVAGAIQDWDRGIIVGRRSFGKGLVQEQFKFEDGSALRLTVSRYYTPAGRSIQKPYNDDFDAYYSEAMHRFENGELVDPDSIEFADSLKFITPTGKVVFGGDGGDALVEHVCSDACVDGNHDYKHGEKGHVCGDACAGMDASSKS